MTGGARKGPAELTELEHDQGRPRPGPGDPHEGVHGPRREVGEHLGVLDHAERVHGVHADPVHLGHGHLPEGVDDGLPEAFADGPEHLLAVPGFSPA